MDTSTIIWIIVAVALVAAVIVVVRSRSGARRAQAQREQAAGIRKKALEHDRRLRENEADRFRAQAESRSEGHDQRRTGTG